MPTVCCGMPAGAAAASMFMRQTAGASVRYRFRHDSRVAPPSSALTPAGWRSEEHTSELQSLMRISYAVFCLKNKTNTRSHNLEVNIHYKANKEHTDGNTHKY